MLSYPDARELDELRDAVRGFAVAEIAPLGRRMDRPGSPRELWPKTGEIGILGYEIGGGTSEIRRMLIGRELLR